MFRGLMFESEATGFQRAGIQIGADASEIEESLLRESLAPFGVARRNSALEMSRLYALLFCFENEIRSFIRERLEENEGLDWHEKLPPRILSHVDGRKKAALKDSWLEGEKIDLLGFVDFGQLGQIIVKFCLSLMPRTTQIEYEYYTNKRFCRFSYTSSDLIWQLPDFRRCLSV